MRNSFSAKIFATNVDFDIDLALVVFFVIIMIFVKLHVLESECNNLK